MGDGIRLLSFLPALKYSDSNSWLCTPKLHAQFNPLCVFLSCCEQGQNYSGAGPCLLTFRASAHLVCLSLSFGTMPRGVASSATGFQNWCLPLKSHWVTSSLISSLIAAGSVRTEEMLSEWRQANASLTFKKGKKNGAKETERWWSPWTTGKKA